MAISKDTELLAQLLIRLARLVAGKYGFPEKDDEDWAWHQVKGMVCDFERAKSDE